MDWYTLTYIVFYLLSGTVLGLAGYVLWLILKKHKKFLMIRRYKMAEIEQIPKGDSCRNCPYLYRPFLHDPMLACSFLYATIKTEIGSDKPIKHIKCPNLKGDR